MNNRKLNQWLWKWHFIAGIISLPFVLVLAVTGAVYLFKPQIETPILEKLKNITVESTVPMSYNQQWEIAKKYLKKKPSAMVLSKVNNQATEFVTGRFSHKTSLFVNKYTGELTGNFTPKSTWMYTVRKLHGELLGGKIGTKIVELIASWMVVLIITGLYIWWPFERGIKGVFTIRFKQGKRMFFRDVHAVLGFWFSGLLLLTLAGGFPWTDVFGSNFKWVQKVTNTGYPKTWNGRGLQSVKQNELKVLTLDEMVAVAKKQNLEGVVSIGLPKLAKNTFSVSNHTFNFDAIKMLHFNQYSGKLIKKHTWADVGVLMRARMWLMAFHQGQFGSWNFWLMFIVAIGLTLMSIAAIFSYVLRKPKNKLGVPKTSKTFAPSISIIISIIVLAILLPVFGVSIAFIFLFEFIKNIKNEKIFYSIS